MLEALEGLRKWRIVGVVSCAAAVVVRAYLQCVGLSVAVVLGVAVVHLAQIAIDLDELIAGAVVVVAERMAR